MCIINFKQQYQMLEATKHLDKIDRRNVLEYFIGKGNFVPLDEFKEVIKEANDIEDQWADETSNTILDRAFERVRIQSKRDSFEAEGHALLYNKGD